MLSGGAASFASADSEYRSSVGGDAEFWDLNERVREEEVRGEIRPRIYGDGRQRAGVLGPRRIERRVGGTERRHGEGDQDRKEFESRRTK